jgi:hypothetical protein
MGYGRFKQKIHLAFVRILIVIFGARRAFVFADARSAEFSQMKRHQKIILVISLLGKKMLSSTFLW